MKTSPKWKCWSRWSRRSRFPKAKIPGIVADPKARIRMIGTMRRYHKWNNMSVLMCYVCFCMYVYLILDSLTLLYSQGHCHDMRQSWHQTASLGTSDMPRYSNKVWQMLEKTTEYAKKIWINGDYTHTHTLMHIYIYIYIYLSICVCAHSYTYMPATLTFLYMTKTSGWHWLLEKLSSFRDGARRKAVVSEDFWSRAGAEGHPSCPLVN